MELKTEKYVEFEVFMNNLSNNKANLIAKLADAQDKITLFDTELNSAKAMCIAVDGKIEELTTKLKDNLTDIGLQAEHGIWTVRKSEYGGRVDTLKVALKAAKKEYEALILQNKELDPTPYANEAVEEMDSEIKRLYADFCASINEAIKARAAYLKLIGIVNALAYDGRRAVFAGQKAQSYATLKLTPSGDFSTGTKQFIVNESEVIKL